MAVSDAALALDHSHGQLYVADTAGGRILRLAIAGGTPSADVPTLDPIAIHRQMDGVSLVEVVAPGSLTAPSGIALSSDRIIATDNATSRIWWFKLDGTPLGSVDTGLHADSLSGIAIGPDGKLYLSDLLTGGLSRGRAVVALLDAARVRCSPSNEATAFSPDFSVAC